MTPELEVLNLSEYEKRTFMISMIIQLTLAIKIAFGLLKKAEPIKESADTDVKDADVIGVKILKKSSFEREMIKELHRQIDVLRNKQAETERKLNMLIYQIEKQKGVAHV